MRFLGFAMNSTLTVQPTMAWLMAGGFNFEGGFRDELEALDVHSVAVAPGARACAATTPGLGPRRLGASRAEVVWVLKGSVALCVKACAATASGGA